MDGAMRGFGVHALAEEAHVLHLLPDEAAGDADLLAADDDDLLTVEKLLGDDGSETAEHVVASVDHHPLRAHAGT